MEQRTITLKHTKRRLTEEEKKKHEEVQPMTEPGNCGQWYLVWYESYQAWFSCRVCYQGYPTQWPYEECIQMPD